MEDYGINVKDYQESKIKAVLPDEFIRLVSDEENPGVWKANNVYNGNYQCAVKMCRGSCTRKVKTPEQRTISN